MRYVIQDLPYFNRSIEANFSNHIIANPGAVLIPPIRRCRHMIFLEESLRKFNSYKLTGDYGLSERLWGLKEGERSPLLETPEVKAGSRSTHCGFVQ